MLTVAHDHPGGAGTVQLDVNSAADALAGQHCRALDRGMWEAKSEWMRQRLSGESYRDNRSSVGR